MTRTEFAQTYQILMIKPRDAGGYRVTLRLRNESDALPLAIFTPTEHIDDMIAEIER